MKFSDALKKLRRSLVSATSGAAEGRYASLQAVRTAYAEIDEYLEYLGEDTENFLRKLLADGEITINGVKFTTPLMGKRLAIIRAIVANGDLEKLAK